MRSDRFILIIKFKKTDLCGSPRFSCFRRIFPHSIFVAQRFERNLLRRLLRLLSFCGTIVFDNAYPYLWFVRRAFGSPDIMQRAGLSIRNLVGVFWRLLVVSEILPFVVLANRSKSTFYKILYHETKF